MKSNMHHAYLFLFKSNGTEDDGKVIFYSESVLFF